QGFHTLWNFRESTGDFPEAGKELRIVDRDFIVDVAFADDGKAFDGMQRLAQVRDFPRVRHTPVEVRRIDDEWVALPVADRIPHEQANVFAEMLTPFEIDDAAGVVVVVQDDDASGSLKDRIRIVAVFSFEQPRQRAPRIEFDMPQVFWWIHIEEELP